MVVTLNVRSVQDLVNSILTFDLFKLMDHNIIGLIETRHKSELEIKLRHKADNS